MAFFINDQSMLTLSDTNVKQEVFDKKMKQIDEKNIKFTEDLTSVSNNISEKLETLKERVDHIDDAVITNSKDIDELQKSLEKIKGSLLETISQLKIEIYQDILNGHEEMLNIINRYNVINGLIEGILVGAVIVLYIIK